MVDKTMWSDLTFPVSVEPDLTGEHGKAWLCKVDVGQHMLNVKPEEDSCVCHWVVEAAWAHPAWHSYSVFCQHLRPVLGHDQPIQFHLDGATHEMMVFALDPRKDREELIKTGIVEKRWLGPANFGAQFIELDDSLAIERIRSTVKEIVDGALSPDADYRWMWAKRFGGNMLKD